jgi:uncharacterized protein (TIGR00369 family)
MTDHTTTEVRARIEGSFVRQGLMTALGARLDRIEPGTVSIRLSMGAAVTQQHGYFHAGATSAIADSAGGYAGLTLMPEGSEVLTVEYKINLVAPAIGNELEAVGTVLKAGRTLTICRLDVFTHRAGERKLVAAGQQTLIRVES